MDTDELRSALSGYRFARGDLDRAVSSVERAGPNAYPSPEAAVRELARATKKLLEMHGDVLDILVKEYGIEDMRRL